MKNHFSFPAAILLAAAAAPSVLAQTTAPVNTPPLTEIAAVRAAKTIRVTETSYLRDRDASGALVLSPAAKMDITFARPEEYRISLVDLGSRGASVKPDIFVADGKTATEYVASSNQYLTRTLATDAAYEKYKSLGAVSYGLSTVLKLGFKSRFDMLSDGFTNALKVRPDGTFGTAPVSLDGQPATLVTITSPPSKDPRMLFTDTRLWIGEKSGLPLRYESYYVNNGKETIFARIDYSNWVIDKPVAPAAFTWAAPATATPYPDESLLAVGSQAPDFSAVTPEGKTVHLSDFKGKAVILDFWATWCVPCQQSMPHLESVYQQIKGQPVTVLAICVWDNKAAYTRWAAAKKDTYSFPTVFDTAENAADNIARSKFGIHAIPTQYLIDKDGKIAFAKTDSYKPGDHDLEDALARLDIKTKAEPVTAAR